MVDGKVFLIIGILGWAVLIGLEVAGFEIVRGGESIKWLLTSVFVLGFLMRELRGGFQNCAAAISDGFKGIAPTLDKGFRHLSATIQSIDLEAKDIADFLPNKLRYIDYDLAFEVDCDSKDATISRNYTVRNITDSVLNIVPLPTYGIDAADLDDLSKLDEFLGLKVDGKNEDRQVESMRTLRTVAASLYPGRPYKNLVEANYRIPLVLKPMQTARIELRHRAAGSTLNIEELEVFGARIIDITEKMTLKVTCTEGYGLRLMETADFPNGVQAINTVSQDPVTEEIERMLLPERLGPNSVYWKVEKPKIGCTYAVRVQAQKVE